MFSGVCMILSLTMLVPALVSSMSTVPQLCPPSTDSNPSGSPIQLGHPDYCNVYVVCENGVGTMKECPEGSNWSDDYAMCVEFNSAKDTCTRKNAKRECASHPDVLIAHPTLCHRYYDCSRPTTHTYYIHLRAYDEECPYPQVFDIDERKCKPFQDAKCGPDRVVKKDACDYVRNLCGSGHCESCNYRMPSCDGLSDGLHEHPLKIWSPHYIECQADRLAGTFECPWSNSALRTFSPVKLACVTQWEVPRERGGLAPSCDGREPGQYRTEERPDIYFTCPGALVAYCEEGQVFDEQTGRCGTQK